MTNPKRYDRPGDGRIDPRVIYVAVPIFALVAFLFGMLVIGPRLQSPSEPPSNEAQMPRAEVHTPAPAPTPQPEAEPNLDIEITERLEDANADSEDVKANEEGLTITLEPGDRAEEKPADSRDTAEEPKEDEKPRTAEVEKPRKPSSQAEKPADKERDSTAKPRETNPEAADRGTYRVQAGAFANKTSADSLVADLGDHGYKAEVKAVKIEDRTLYRVTIGEYKSRRSAESIAEDLKSDGYQPAVVSEKRSE